jgi:hypothetical protein
MKLVVDTDSSFDVGPSWSQVYPGHPLAGNASDLLSSIEAYQFSGLYQ